MCEKTYFSGPANEIDPCLVEELETIKNTFPRFKEKFKDIMSCCGHGKYKKTFVVQNRYSQAYFEWFSSTSLTITKRSDSRSPFYKSDNEGYYYIPEVEMREEDNNRRMREEDNNRSIWDFDDTEDS